MQKRFMKNSLKGLIAGALVLSTVLPTAAVSAATPGERDYSHMLNQLGVKQEEVSQSSLSQNKGQQEIYEKDVLVIKYNKTIPNAQHKKLGTSLVRKVANLQYDVVKITNGQSIEEMTQAYLKRADVESVSRSAKITKSALPDPKTDSMYHLDLLNIDDASKLAGKNKVRVAVVDTGIDASHPELRNKIVHNYNVLDPLKKGAPDLHGTHVAGIIAAEKNNGQGGQGISPNVDIISIDVFNRSYSSTDYTIAEGILKAVEQKAQVINLSLGSSVPSPIIEDAIKVARDANITIVAAAGNSGADMKEYPASFDGVISVGATNDENMLADFSTYGPTVDVVAPGAAVYSSAYSEKGSTYEKLDGTSMASPVVAGAVALLLSKNKNLTPHQIQYMLTKTSTDLGAKGYDEKYGYGLVNPVAALKYNVNSLPAVAKVKESQLVDSAKQIDVADKNVSKGSITKFEQVDYYQFDVQAEENYQFVLEQAENVDYAFDLYFFPEGETEEAETHLYVNDQTKGKVEGSLFTAPAEGTVVIGVRDGTKKYNEAAKESYTLTTSKVELTDDDLSDENIYSIKEFPFNSSEEIGDLFFVDRRPAQEGEVTEGEEDATTEELPEEEVIEEEIIEIPTEEEVDFSQIGDSDQFTFTAPENTDGIEETIKINLSGVAGIDSTINLYHVEKFEMDGEVFEDKWLYDSSNTGGYGQGEQFTFNAMPGATYVIEITNNPFSDYYYYEDIMFLIELGFMQEFDLSRNFSSSIPYQVTMEKTTLPADEDGFPMESIVSEELITEEYLEIASEQKTSLKSVFLEEILYPYYGGDDYYDQIKDIAIPFALEETQTGHFQYMGDEDWYKLETTKTGMYEIATASNGLVPAADIYQEDPETGDIVYIGTNQTYTNTGENQDASLVVGLKSGQTYYFSLRDPMYRSSFDEYSFTVNYVMDAPVDANEDNDTFNSATGLRLETITANHSTLQDADIYYFKPYADEVIGFRAKPTTFAASGEQVPSEALVQLDPVVLLFEDTDGNQKLEDEETGNVIITDKGFWGEEEQGSFKALKSKGYFIAVFDYYGNTSSFQSYDFTLASAHMRDEDQGSVIKNNVPSKPIALSKAKNGDLSAKGYMNISEQKGDVDYYKLVITGKKEMYKVSLDVPTDLDGSVSIYEAKGKQLLSKDDYGSGDAEEFFVNLKKGTYYVKVEDTVGNASISPYQLKLEKQ